MVNCYADYSELDLNDLELWEDQDFAPSDDYTDESLAYLVAQKVGGIWV